MIEPKTSISDAEKRMEIFTGRSINQSINQSMLVIARTIWKENGGNGSEAI